MKQLIYGIIITFISIFTIVIILTINGKSNRSNEINNALSIAVENAVETTMNQNPYTINNNKEFLADFTQNLLSQISNDSDIEIKVAKIDYKKGIMSVRVTETFTHPNGNEGKNECETTVIFEHVPTNDELITITYQIEPNIIYKEYQIVKGDDIIVPKNPQKAKMTFVGWKDPKTNTLVTEFGQADKNITYVAEFQ